MEIIIGKTAGFCFGVSNAVNKAEEELKSKKNVFCLGELVHNKQVTKELEDKGLIVINDIEEAQKNVIIRAHGEPNKTYEKAKELKINILDFTCPKVLKIHKIAEEYATKGFYIILVGQKEHPEIIGTISYCGENSIIIDKEEEVEKALNEFYNTNQKKILVISQTTFSLEKFDNIISLISEKISNKNIEIEIKRTICDATKIRQQETEEIANKVDIMIIIGGKHSSNTNKLYDISKKHCQNSILIETKEELDVDYIKKYKKIGIMAGASTSKKSIESVVEILKHI